MIDVAALETTIGGNRLALLVEGAEDFAIITAWLDAGTTQGEWGDWRSRLVLFEAEYATEILKFLKSKKYMGRLYGVMDRDRRVEVEITELRRAYPTLHIWDRVMIENYFIDPDELLTILPVRGKKTVTPDQIRRVFEEERENWIRHGALLATLHEEGARQFCYGEEGYPNALTKVFIETDFDYIQVEARLEELRENLAPSAFTPKYEARLKRFEMLSSREQYHYCINGKEFFHQVVATKILNRYFGQRSVREWWSILLQNNKQIACPQELIKFMKPVLT